MARWYASAPCGPKWRTTASGTITALEDAQIELRDRETKRRLDARVSVGGQRGEL